MKRERVAVEELLTPAKNALIDSAGYSDFISDKKMAVVLSRVHNTD